MTETKIRCKGKNKNNEWVYGYIERDPSKWLIDKNKNTIGIAENCNSVSISYDIIASTICFYTGQTDANGREIYAGDILKFTREIHSVDGVDIGSLHIETYMKVYYDEISSSWVMMELNLNDKHSILLDSINEKSKYRKYFCFVVGNTLG